MTQSNFVNFSYFRVSYMASSSCRPLFVLALALLLTSIGSSEARQYLVGNNPHAWRPRASAERNLQSWSEAQLFRVGDELLIKPFSVEDPILEVTEKDFLSCHTSKPIRKHINRHTGEGKMTVIKLDRPGDFFFVGGYDRACKKGEKMMVQVMSPKHHVHSTPPPPSPPPVVASTSSASSRAAILLVLPAILGLACLLA